MTIQSLLQEVLDLQPEWSHLKTPAMDRRGVIVRRDLRSALEEHRAALSEALGPYGSDLGIEGRDGTGPKTEIPWTRVYSTSRSPRATTGWYVVYLFSAEGDNCYLTLGYGSTEWTGVEFQPRPPAQLSALMKWARTRLATESHLRPDMIQSISLDARRSNLGPAYEAGTALGFVYPSGSIPADDVLLEDLEYLLTLLQAVYRLEETDDALPGVVAPEVLDALEDASKAAGKSFRRPRGQGRRQSAAERKAIEERAVQVATDHLTERGFDIEYVGDTESYDIKATRTAEVLYVEVKGTTSLGEEVVLTANEVAFHRTHHPHNALVVVHGIRLDRSGPEPAAHGGSLSQHHPWLIADEALRPVSFRYTVPEPTPAQD